MLFKQGNFDQGVLAGVHAMVATVRGEDSPPGKPAGKRQDDFFAVPAVLMFFFIGNLFRKSKAGGAVAGGIGAPLIGSLFYGLSIPLAIALLAVSIVFGLISQEKMDIEVEEEAMKSFFTEKLYATRDANGILLFISIFEKKVWILADRSIRDKIPQQSWDALVSGLTAKISSKDRCAALCRTITHIGDLLEQHFPCKRDDTDELHNLIIK